VGHKGYGVSLDYGAYYGFHIVYGNFYHIGCDVICLADYYRLLVKMFSQQILVCAEKFFKVLQTIVYN